MKKSSFLGSEIEIALPAEASPEELKRAVARIGGGNGPFRIVRQCLDARRKPDIRWNYRITVGLPATLPEPDQVYRSTISAAFFINY